MSKVLFGLIKEVMKRRPDLKLVVMHLGMIIFRPKNLAKRWSEAKRHRDPRSATMDAQKMQGYFVPILVPQDFLLEQKGAIFRQTDSKLPQLWVCLRKTGRTVNYCPNSYVCCQGQCTAVEYPWQNAPGGDILHLGARERSLVLGR